MTSYWHDDPTEVSINQICRLAHASKPSVYREFGSADGLMRAALERYIDQVGADVIAILKSGQGMSETLDALISFACDDPRMETGCLFYKTYHARRRLGPLTRAKAEALQTFVTGAYAAFLRPHLDGPDWPRGVTLEGGARYLATQVGMAVTHRASGTDAEDVREMLMLALSMWRPADA